MVGSGEGRRRILAKPSAYILRVFLPSLLAWIASLGVMCVFLYAYNIPISFHTLMRICGGNSIANVTSVTPGGAGVTQAFNVASLNGITSAANATAYSVAQQLVTTAWNIVFGIIMMAWAFGWSGGESLVRSSYTQAKQKTAEQNAARKERKAAKKAAEASRSRRRPALPSLYALRTPPGSRRGGIGSVMGVNRFAASAVVALGLGVATGASSSDVLGRLERRGAGEHVAADGERNDPAGTEAVRVDGQLDRRHHDQLRVRLAALQQLRHELRRHLRRGEPDVHARQLRRRQDRPRRRHRLQLGRTRVGGVEPDKRRSPPPETRRGRRSSRIRTERRRSDRP